MKFASKPKRKVNLNLTSLIDVLFILIIFFAVSSTFLEQPGIKLKLPEAESGDDIPVDEIIVQVDQDGNIFLNDTAISLDSLALTVASLKASENEKGVTLKADGDVKHSTVIGVMDLLRREGIYKITISTANLQNGK